MAGAGYKLFNTGDVLTAAQVNTYLQEQAVMVFANAAARTTALSGVLAEGMITYLKDTDAVEKYDGSAWVSIGGSSVPDSYGFAAGKNKIINGAFDIWQRGTSVNLSSNTSTFLADRFACSVVFSAGTASISQQTFTPGTAPVSGYEAQYYQRLNTGTTATYLEMQTKLEDVRTFAGKTVTISFWAKASSAVTLKNLIRQNFGSGGSSSVNDEANFNITTSWVRYSRTLTLGSMSGKTIGTSSFLQIFLYQDTGALGGLTIDLWGMQLEANSTATTFQTATGTIQGELAACQRYYLSLGGDAYQPFGNAAVYSSSAANVIINLLVQMRVAPAFSTTGSFALVNSTNGVAAVTGTSLDRASTTTVNFGATGASGLSAGNASRFIANNDATARLQFSAEL